jgi:hypothetical protein
MDDHRCDCGCTPPHSDPAMCARNRAATRDYMNRMTAASIDGAVARGQRLAREHDEHGHPRPVYGCFKCPA